MNLNSILFIVLVILVSVGITSILIVGWESVAEDEFVIWRMDQLRQKQITDEDILPEIRLGEIVLSDYFRQKNDAYFYLGGLPGTQWTPGQSYRLEEIKEVFLNRIPEQENFFYAQLLGENSLYINLDRGGKDLTKKYLQTLDQYQISGFDTLFIDFRFMRSIDFSQLIALFNQLGPQEKTFLGTVTNPYEEVELETSGQPFFHADRYVFLVHEDLSDPLKGLIEVFRSQEGYRIRGPLESSQDTICVYTGYEIGDEYYRICADQFVPAQYGFSKEKVITPAENDAWQEMFLEMEKNWYSSRDTTFMKNHLPLWLGM